MKAKILTEAQIVALLNSRCKHERQATVARSLGVTPQLICDIRNGRKRVSPQLLAGLGYRRVVRYEPR